MFVTTAPYSPLPISVLVSKGTCNKAQQSRSFKTTEMYSVTVGMVKSKIRIAGLVPSEDHEEEHALCLFPSFWKLPEIHSVPCLGDAPSNLCLYHDKVFAFHVSVSSFPYFYKGIYFS